MKNDSRICLVDQLIEITRLAARKGRGDDLRFAGDLLDLLLEKKEQLEVQLADVEKEKVAA